MRKNVHKVILTKDTGRTYVHGYFFVQVECGFIKEKQDIGTFRDYHDARMFAATFASVKGLKLVDEDEKEKDEAKKK